MIRELRIRHRRMIPVLAVLSAILFVAAIKARKDIPTHESTLASNELPLPSGATLVPLHFEQLEGTVEAKIHTAQTTVLEINIQAPLKLADPLVYWTPSDMKEAQLLGALPPAGRQVFELKNMQGAILIYSLAHQEVIDRADIPTEVSP